MWENCVVGVICFAVITLIVFGFFELLQGYNIVSINDYYTTFLIDDHDMIYFFKERIIEVSTLIVDYYAQT